MGKWELAPAAALADYEALIQSLHATDSSDRSPTLCVAFGRSDEDKEVGQT
jgi:hypothetical protein